VRLVVSIQITTGMYRSAGCSSWKEREQRQVRERKKEGNDDSYNTFPQCNCDLIKIAGLLDSCSDRSRMPICVFIAADDDRVLNSMWKTIIIDVSRARNRNGIR